MTKRSDFQLPVRTSIDADARVIAWDPTDPNGEPFVVPASVLSVTALTVDANLLTRTAGVPAEITRANLAADAAFTAVYEPVQVGTNTNIGLSTHTVITGSNNNAFGASAQRLMESGGSNNAFGVSTQRSLTTGNSNSAFGNGAQYSPNGVTANAHVSAARGVSVGTDSGLGSASQDADITTIGWQAIATGAGATSLGSGAHAAHTMAVALGMSTVTTAASQVHLGSRHMEMVEITAPAAGATNSARIFAEDNGAGKTRLMVRFATGAVQQLAIEP